MAQRTEADKPKVSSPSQVPERGPFGGRLISLAEACELADQAALAAESAQQEVRVRDAADWAWLMDGEAEDAGG